MEIPKFEFVDSNTIKIDTDNYERAEYTPKSKAGKWFNDRLPCLLLEHI